MELGRPLDVRRIGDIELMKFNCYRLMLMNNKLLRFHHIRHSHTHDELLPMKKMNIISYAPVKHRNTVISKIETIVTICGGYVDDFNFFSDLAATLRILGIKQPDTLRQFYQRLKLDIEELQLDDETINMLNTRSFSVDRYSLFILFQILFIDAKGDLRQNVPAVNN
ncbi:unnamed protein product [Didymodactylos carnosus]|uniref:Uncharacterized protein n=1 Tax=Didymodactylos carnosus TaxID=1234261 RepID=A0A814RGN1_9BILA|nr:unnamed protein product [Didymodactylos carnosus]CAF1277224.1 unnamed protein product [Didymodactylos carnosus]CAF3895903.1 unnamed protein product [Didymodactylos carnosus]CAF4082270.1 unnamed protein product [Didymodactylos carnosus]